jgi:hypothetical protein
VRQGAQEGSPLVLFEASGFVIAFPTHLFAQRKPSRRPSGNSPSNWHTAAQRQTLDGEERQLPQYVKELLV